MNTVPQETFLVSLLHISFHFIWPDIVFAVSRVLKQIFLTEIFKDFQIPKKGTSHGNVSVSGPFLSHLMRDCGALGCT